MRLTEYFIPTLREDPAEAEVVSHRLMLRAGMINKLAAGVYNYLPLGLRSIRKFETIVRECMNEAGAIETLMAAVQPAELWEESGRWGYYGKELLRLKDRHDRSFCIGPTHEEVITDIVRSFVRSYKQLPVNLYQIQTKFRDEVRPRFGLMRGREFIMKDAYSFDTTNEGAETSYGKMRDAYCKIFEKCGLDYRMVEADSGAIGGSFSHEFMVLAETGEDVVISCSKCNYSANLEKAVVVDSGEVSAAEMNPIERVVTKGAHTVADVSKMLNLSPAQIVKTMIVVVDEKPVAVLIRGDHELNLAKVKNHFGASVAELATPDVIRAVTNGPVGFSGPIGLTIPLLADNAVKYLRNIGVGGNELDIHLEGVNLDRDFTVGAFGDFRNAIEGDTCPHCGGGYMNTRGIEVGHIFKLGTKYSKAMKAQFLDSEGKQNDIVMGCYGIGIGRTVAASIEQNHDENGIIWPVALAPFEVVIVPLNTNDEEVKNVAETIYIRLKHYGVDALLDDRDERAGVKFNDADLVGYPVRVNIGKKGLADGNVEIVIRRTKETITVRKDESIDKVRELLKTLK